MNRLAKAAGSIGRNSADTKTGARFEIAMSLAVLASIAVMAMETFTLPAELMHALFALDVVLSLLFLAEYVLRIALAENKIAYVTSFFGIIDLIALFPILAHAVSSARVVRLLRVLRIIRLLKIKRYDAALDRYRRALKLIAAEAMLFTGAALSSSWAFAFMIYEFEHEAQPEVYGNIFDSIWWAVISLTSVGYGDVFPVTAAGRMLTLAMVLTGMGIVAVPTALLASALSRACAMMDDGRSVTPLEREPACPTQSAAYPTPGPSRSRRASQGSPLRSSRSPAD